MLPDGRFALGTTGSVVGLVVIDRAGRLLHHLDREAGLQDNTVFNAYVDAAGSLWLSLGSKGIAFPLLAHYNGSFRRR